MITYEDYIRQIREMNCRAKEWREKNSDKVVKIQFNFPKNVQVIGVISEAITTGFVTTNEAGLELLKALYPWGTRDEPTVTMVRVALEVDENYGS